MSPKKRTTYGKQISEFIIESLILEMLSEKTMRRLVRAKAPPKKIYDDLAAIDQYMTQLFKFI